MLKRTLKRMAARAAATTARALPRGLAQRLLKPDAGDYRQVWVDAVGAPLRREIYERQRAGGTRPLTDHPTVAEVAAVLRAEHAKKILDAGCGWGRLMAGLAGEFAVDGCDASPDLLRLVPPGLNTFELDLAIEQMAFVRANAGRWDAAFTRGLLACLIGRPEGTMYIVNNLLALTRGNVHVWEIPDACAWVAGVYGGPRVVLHPIAVREE
jgi:hypothetical protein